MSMLRSRPMCPAAVADDRCAPCAVPVFASSVHVPGLAGLPRVASPTVLARRSSDRVRYRKPDLRISQRKAVRFQCDGLCGTRGFVTGLSADSSHEPRAVTPGSIRSDDCVVDNPFGQCPYVGVECSEVRRDSSLVIRSAKRATSFGVGR